MTLTTAALLMTTNAFAAGIVLDESCSSKLEAKTTSIRNQVADIILSTSSAGKIQYAAHLLDVSFRYVLNHEMTDQEISDVASICEINFDIKKLVDINRF